MKNAHCICRTLNNTGVKDFSAHDPIDTQKRFYFMVHLFFLFIKGNNRNLSHRRFLHSVENVEAKSCGTFPWDWEGNYFWVRGLLFTTVDMDRALHNHTVCRQR